MSSFDRGAVYGCLCALLVLISGPARAAVVEFEVEKREPVLGGRSFGQTGPYEKISGQVHFAVDGFAPENAAVVDLRAAETDDKGQVTFSSDFFALRPVRGGNGSMLLEIPNRGEKTILTTFQGGDRSRDPTDEAHFGDLFFLNRGFTLVWLGWQFDVRDEPGLLRFKAPRVPGVTGLVRSDFTPSEKRTTQPLGHVIAGKLGGTEYPVANPEHPRTELTVRDTPDGPRTTIERSEWRWIRTENEITGIVFDAGFEPGRIYELTYEAADPVVVGTGLLAVRDFAAHVKTDQTSPLKVQRVLAFGYSQSGRFLRHYIYQGFNGVADGSLALDGIFSDAAGAGRGSFNHRFAQPSRDAQPLESLFFPTDLFPFTDSPTRNPFTRTSAGLRSEETAPKTIYTNTSYDYWGRAASLIHTTPDGKADAPIPENVRIYHLAGVQHLQTGFPPKKIDSPHIRGRFVANPNPSRWSLRAALIGLDRWVRGVGKPPSSVYPRISDGTLVTVESVLRSFPAIPGVDLPKGAHLARNVNYGLQWHKGIITQHPPRVGRPYVSLVPAVDSVGNDRGGIRIPQLVAPVATYTPWNLRDPSIGASNERVSFLGSFLPFPTKATAGDPRTSVTERYPDRRAYLGEYTAAALKLVEGGYLLPEDLPSVLARGLEEWDYVQR